MASLRNRPNTLLLGAALFTTALTAGCISGGGGGGSGSTPGLAPSVTEVNPEAGSTGAVITAIVLALFDQDMDFSSITSSNFTLTGPSGDVPGDVSCDTPCRTVAFEPDDPLDGQESYTATVDETVRDVDGEQLPADFSWTFSTAPEMVRASTNTNDIGGINDSRNAATDNSGRFVAFDSLSNNLVAGDSNAAFDVFVKDTQSGAIERVSVNAAGVEGNGNSARSAISADGRYVTFESAANNLLSGATLVAGVQIYIKDRETGSVTLVSADGSDVPGNGDSIDPSMSADGRYVAFQSIATNLVAGATASAGTQVYVRDLQTGAIKLISADGIGTPANANSTSPTISANGEFVVFESSAPNFGGTGGSETQIFRKDLVTQELLPVSETDPAPLGTGALGNGISANPSISSDGQFVAFQTRADNLGANGTVDQVVRKNMQSSSGSVVVASADNSGIRGNRASVNPSISDDGRYVAFQSRADLTVVNNGWSQIFVKDLQGGITGPIALVSQNALGVQGAAPVDGDSVGAAITRDGGYVAFDSGATNLLIDDLNGVRDVFRGLNSTFAP